MHTDLVDTTSGYQVPVRYFHTRDARANLVLMAALGISARFYVPLAEALHDIGLNVLLVEQRGHGDSALRPSRRVDFGFREAIMEDVPAVMAWLQTHAPGLPLYLMGHSLGGHYAAITAGRFPEQVAGVIVAACGSPWTDGFSGATRRQLKLLLKIIPLCNLGLGYYPGDKIGFGGRESRTLMRDWAALATTNRYQAIGVDEDLEAGIAGFTGPVLSLRMADDAYAPEAAMAAVTDKFLRAPVSKHVVTAEQIGDQADHFRWVRKPEAVAEHVQAWLPA